MPPSRGGEHRWTKFELRTMLALIARGAHLEDRPSKRTDSTDLTRNNAYEKFATLFNEAVHGKFNYEADVDKREIIRMLDSLMQHRKNVVGKNGLVERQPIARITRALRLAWERSDGRDFDGSLAEWESGRRDMVIRKDMIARGLIPKTDLVEGAATGGGILEKNLSFSLALNTYTSEPSIAPAAYARRYTPSVRQKRSVTESNDQGTYPNRQLEKVHAAATSTSRAPINRGKKSHLSAVYINNSDEDDDLEVSIIPKRIFAPATLTKKHDAIMNTLSSFAVQPSKVKENGHLGWMNPGGAMSPKPPGLPKFGEGSVGGRIGGVGEVVKLKRPGRNARRMNINLKVTKDIDTLYQDFEADTIKEKEMGTDKGRMDDDLLPTNKEITNKTAVMHVTTGPQVNDFHNLASDFSVPTNVNVPDSFHTQ